MNIVSSSANDVNTTGSGAQIILITGGNTTANHSELVNLNGTNTVTTSNTYTYVNRVAVAFSGSSRYNEGLIELTQSSSGLKLAEIVAQNSITQQLVYTVPYNYQGYFKGFSMNAVKQTGGQSPIVELTLNSYNPDSNSIYKIKDYLIDESVENTITVTQPFANLSDSLTTLFWNVDTDRDDTRVYGEFYLELVLNS